MWLNKQIVPNAVQIYTIRAEIYSHSIQEGSINISQSRKCVGPHNRWLQHIKDVFGKLRYIFFNF